MKITETVTRDVVSVEVTDECMVGIVTATPETVLFPASARELAGYLVRAADEAERASAELFRNVVPAKFDQVDERPWTPGDAA